MLRKIVIKPTMNSRNCPNGPKKQKSKKAKNTKKQKPQKPKSPKAHKPQKPKSQIWFHIKSSPKDFFRRTLVNTLHFIHNNNTQ